MPTTDRFRRYVEAGMTFTQVTRAKAEELVQELARSGEIQRTQTQEWVDGLIERSRASTDALVATVRSEVRRQLAALGFDDPEEVRKLVEEVRTQVQRVPAGLLAREVARGIVRSGLSDKVREAATAARGAAGNMAPGKKAAAKKAAPGKKAPAKKAAPGKKAAATKAAAKKAAPGKKAAAKKAAPAAKARPAKKAQVATKTSRLDPGSTEHPGAV